jgi:hypothetical protein
MTLYTSALDERSLHLCDEARLEHDITESTTARSAKEGKTKSWASALAVSTESTADSASLHPSASATRIPQQQAPALSGAVIIPGEDGRLGMEVKEAMATHSQIAMAGQEVTEEEGVGLVYKNLVSDLLSTASRLSESQKKAKNMQAEAMRAALRKNLAEIDVARVTFEVARAAAMRAEQARAEAEQAAEAMRAEEVRATRMAARTGKATRVNAALAEERTEMARAEAAVAVARSDAKREVAMRVKASRAAEAERADALQAEEAMRAAAKSEWEEALCMAKQVAGNEEAPAAGLRPLRSALRSKNPDRRVYFESDEDDDELRYLSRALWT